MTRALVVAVVVASFAGVAAAGPLESARASARRGDYAEAVATLESARAAGGPEVVVALGQAYFDVGRYAEAEDALKSAAGALPDASAAQREVLLARLDSEQGRYAEGIKRLVAEVKKRPRNFEARVVLGELRYVTGTPRAKLTEADAIADYYTDGVVTSARDLALLGRALALTEHYENANTIFAEALEADPNEQLAHFYWAELFLLAGRNEKEADASVKELLRRNPSHPGALTLTALMDLTSDNDATAAVKNAQAALAINPRYIDAHHALAQAYLATEQYGEAKRVLEDALTLNPRNPRTLALLAGTELLLENRAGFDAAMKRALAVNKRYAEGWHLVADLVEARHRYEDAVAFERKAIALDDEYWPAWVGLGMGLSRVGKDDEAAKALETAADGDTFDVLAYNMTEFIYDGAAKRMVWEEASPWRIRFEQNQREVLAPLVKPMLGKAFDYYSKAYGFKPTPPLHVEYFPDRKIFAVRTVGTPGLAAHGVCFGHVVTLVSPSNADHAWPMVLWHELAHIWHHQMSDGRVPRWFTEGLAELETTLAQPQWKREMDGALYAALKEGRLRGIDRFNTMFTQAKSINEIVLAYYYATQVARYIHERWGHAVFAKMLVAWGQKKPTDVVFREVLGVELAAFDSTLKAWLESTWLKRFDGAFDPQAIPAGHPDHEAVVVIQDELKAQDWAGAAKGIDALLESGGRDGPKLREWRALAARGQEDWKAMALHCDRGLELEPENETLQKLAGDAYGKLGDKVAQLQLFDRLALIREDDAALLLAAGCLAEELNDVKGLVRYAALALDVAPFSREVRVLVAKARLAEGNPTQALAEAELALDLPSDADPKEVLTVKAKALMALGRRDDAKRVLEKYTPPGGDIEDALRKLQEVDL